MEEYLQKVRSGQTSPAEEFQLNVSAFWKRKKPSSWGGSQVWTWHCCVFSKAKQESEEDEMKRFADTQVPLSTGVLEEDDDGFDVAAPCLSKAAKRSRPGTREAAPASGHAHFSRFTCTGGASGAGHS